MNSQNKSIELKVFGNNIKIVTDEDEEYVFKVVSYLNSKMDEISKKVKIASDSEKMVLVALNIADEYMKLLDEKGELESLDGEYSNIISIIDDALHNDIS